MPRKYHYMPRYSLSETTYCNRPRSGDNKWTDDWQKVTCQRCHDRHESELFIAVALAEKQLLTALKDAKFRSYELSYYP